MIQRAMDEVGFMRRGHLLRGSRSMGYVQVFRQRPARHCEEVQNSCAGCSLTSAPCARDIGARRSGAGMELSVRDRALIPGRWGALDDRLRHPLA